MLLVIGPTCAGKSTYIQTLKKDAASRGEELQVHLGFEIRRGREVPTGPNDVVHANLLKAGKPGRTDEEVRRVAPTSGADFVELIAAADEFVVLGAPREVLLDRAGKREKLEPDLEDHADTRYKSEKWIEALKTTHLAQRYEQLALTLDGTGKPVRYLCSNHDELVEVARWQYPLLAREDAASFCAAGHEVPELDLGPHTYQADYREGASGSMRSLTLAQALQMPLAGKRVLDIGCAEGAAALSAARMGATVTGLEPKPGRFRKARKISQAFGIPLELHNKILDDYHVPGRSFDVVLALNVIHHVNDPFAFLDRAAHLTTSHLVLEYPGMTDRKFGATIDHDPASDDLPLIAVSKPAEQDQTYVFTPSAFERYLVDILGVFDKHEFFRSPISDRWISVFSRKKGKSNLDSALAREAQLIRRNRELERRIKEFEQSRSWKVTAPLRKVAGRRR